MEVQMATMYCGADVDPSVLADTRMFALDATLLDEIKTLRVSARRRGGKETTHPKPLHVDKTDGARREGERTG